VKAVFVRDGGGVEVREVDVPEIGDGELLVKMVACGVDGTDLEKAFGRPLTPPMLGHEVVGVVENRVQRGLEKATGSSYTTVFRAGPATTV
jgi:threonine dehydrogenase-like Zn-dependent dehydrogenase